VSANPAPQPPVEEKTSLLPHVGGEPWPASNPPPESYRPSVGVLVVNKNGEVWAGCRTNAARLPNRGDDGVHSGRSPWQCPQGGIDDGELAEVAARRELWEETGIASVELVAAHPFWLSYDFPDALLKTWLAKGRGWGGRYRGQAQRWFLFRFVGDEAEVDLEAAGDPEFDEWCWKPLDSMEDLVVDFKRGVYSEVVSWASTLPHDAPKRSR